MRRGKCRNNILYALNAFVMYYSNKPFFRECLYCYVFQTIAKCKHWENIKFNFNFIMIIFFLRRLLFVKFVSLFCFIWWFVGKELVFWYGIISSRFAQTKPFGQIGLSGGNTTFRWFCMVLKRVLSVRMNRISGCRTCSVPANLYRIS